MAESGTQSKSLVEQIVEETLTVLAASKDFREESVEKLRGLAKDGGLKKAPDVTAVLK